MRPLPTVSVLLLAALAGCGSPEPAASAPAPRTSTGAQSSTANPYDAPDMQRAKALRARGYEEAGAGYAAVTDVGKEQHFRVALDFLGQAQQAYHDALTGASERFRPLIEKEIETVASTMRQIQRDRAPLKIQ